MAQSRAPAILLAASLGALIACGGSSKGETTAPSSPIPSAYRGHEPALAAGGAAAYLPSNTLFVLAAGSPRELGEHLGFPELLRDYGDLYHEIVGELSRRFGANLLDPSQLAEVGVDPEAPFGVAILDGEDEAFAFFATLASRSRFEVAAHRSLGEILGELEPRSHGEALVLTSRKEEDASIILRGSQVFLLVTDRREDHQALTARLAVGEGRDTLAGDPDFQRAFEAFDFGADVAGYIALPSIVRSVLARDERFAAEHLERMREQVAQLEAGLEAAREGGAKESELERMRGELRSQREWLERLERRDVGEDRFLRDVVAALGGLAFGAELEGPTVRVKFEARPKPGSLPARVLRPATAPLALLHARPEPPLFAVGGHADTEALLELVDRFLGMEGESLDNLAEDLREEMGVDLEDDLRPLLTGAVGFAFDGPVDVASVERFKEVIQLTFVAGLSDAAGARALLQRAAGQGPLAELAREGPNGVRLAIPLIDDRPLLIDVVGDQLVASTDPEAAGRLAGESAPLAGFSELERDLITSEQSSALFVFRPLLALWLAGGSFVVAESALAYEGSAIPDTERTREIRKELERLEEKTRQKRAELEKVQADLMFDRARALGRTVLVARRQGDSVAALGGLFTPGQSLRPVVQALMEIVEEDLIRERNDGGGREFQRLEAELDGLLQKRWLLERELRAQPAQPPAPKPVQPPAPSP